jgi:hypothetical protein
MQSNCKFASDEDEVSLIAKWCIRWLKVASRQPAAITGGRGHPFMASAPSGGVNSINSGRLHVDREEVIHADVDIYSQFQELKKTECML